MGIELVKSLVLGIVQGITEWLPISSTGHLLLVDQFLALKLSPDAKELFLVLIQLSSIFAVILLYFSTLNPFSPSKKPQQRKETWVLWSKVLVATLPAAVVGILINDFMDKYLYRPLVIALALASYGLVYILLEKRKVPSSKSRVATIHQLTYRDALWLGAFQMLALVPGTSRSGSTILGGLILGLERSVAAQFSFFMAIPVMAGASLLKLLKLGFAYSSSDYLLMVVGCLTSFLVSLVCIKALVAYVRRHDFSIFGYYRIALAVVVAIYFLALGN